MSPRALTIGPANRQNTRMDEAEKRVLIPEGHVVRTFMAAPDPLVGHTPGGTLIANFGCRGDDPAELEQILDRVSVLLDQRSSSMDICDFEGESRVSDVFAPRDVPLRKVESCVVWAASRDG